MNLIPLHSMFDNWDTKDLTLLLALLIQFAAVIIWGAQLTSNMQHVATSLRSVVEKQEQILSDQTELQVRIAVQEALQELRNATEEGQR